MCTYIYIYIGIHVNKYLNRTCTCNRSKVRISFHMHRCTSNCQSLKIMLPSPNKSTTQFPPKIFDRSTPYSVPHFHTKSSIAQDICTHKRVHVVVQMKNNQPLMIILTSESYFMDARRSTQASGCISCCPEPRKRSKIPNLLWSIEGRVLIQC